MREEEAKKPQRIDRFLLFITANLRCHRELSPKESQLRFKITQQFRMNDTLASTVGVQTRQTRMLG